MGPHLNNLLLDYTGIPNFSIPFKLVDTNQLLYFAVVAEPENKFVLLLCEGVASVFEEKHLREGKMSLKFLDEQLRTQAIVFSIKKFSPFFEEFKNQIQMLNEAGKFSYTTGHNFKSQHEQIDAGVPALVLNMEDLGIGFLVCLVPMTLSVVAFVCELVVPRIQTFMREELIFIYLIRAVAQTRLS